MYVHNRYTRSNQTSSLKHLYGITLEEARALYDAQGGKCALCLKPIPWDGKQRAIDHDHATGKVRGILCRPCNHIVGWIEQLPVPPRSWFQRFNAYCKP